MSITFTLVLESIYLKLDSIETFNFTAFLIEANPRKEIGSNKFTIPKGTKSYIKNPPNVTIQAYPKTYSIKLEVKYNGLYYSNGLLENHFQLKKKI